jgi:hypothetical protein
VSAAGTSGISPKNAEEPQMMEKRNRKSHNMPLSRDMGGSNQMPTLGGAESH